MPIVTSAPIKIYDQEMFHKVDRRVTGFAFDIHNEFGRYLDEAMYQSELSRRCKAAGFDVVPELQITVSLDDFRKLYSADLLIDHGVIVETKTVSTIADSHRGQTLNYLFLSGLHHATLLNFRPEQVEREFVSTRLTHTLRQRYTLAFDGFKKLTPQCRRLKEALMSCLKEWGAYLDPLLYRDAMTHFVGGKEFVRRSVAVHSAGATIGQQKMHLLTDDVAFSVTTATHRPESVFDHQSRFLKHTHLRALQWINLNHSHIEVRTIEK
ncbi:MAG: GxxExxY protein [Candidatus Paceibacterota bacterium]